MGPAQEAWLQATLAASVAARQPWQVIGNEVIMGRATMPNLYKAMGAAGVAKLLASMPEVRRAAAAKLIEVAAYGQPFDLDGWDGYPAARARFDAMVAGLGGGNVVVVSGDSHAFWTNTLQPAGGGAPLAVEFGTGPITSPSIADEAGGFQLGPVFEAQNREVRFCDQLAKGYVHLTLTHEAAEARMVAVEIDRKPYKSREIGRWRIAPTPGAGVGPLQRV
jgi:alkaline phosphatase D